MFVRIAGLTWHVWEGQAAIDGTVTLALCHQPEVRQGRELRLWVEHGIDLLPERLDIPCRKCTRIIASRRVGSP